MAAVRGSGVLDASQVRIRGADGEVVGAGFLVAPDLVCTCAHVVGQALGLPPGEDPIEGTVDLDFPLVAHRPSARAGVASWRHGGHDVALLRLEEPVDGTRPAPLVDGTSVWGHTFRALGYPYGADHGIWASGVLRAGQGSGWVQMEVRGSGPAIVGGFSGSPVWDDAQDGVVGMTVAAHQGDRTAYLLPSADLVDGRTLRPRCPFQGIAPFAEDGAEFFHGRDDDTRRVFRAVLRRPVVLVVGPSGCGKSSLVRAGVLPKARAAGMDVSELRAVPGVRAAAVLARALSDLLDPAPGEVERLARAEELARLLEAGRDVPAELRARLLSRPGAAGAGHLLFVDQLEEYTVGAPDDARELFRLLAALAGREGAGLLRVVATGRPGSLETLVTPEFSELAGEAVEFLAALAGDALERAVTEPVAAEPGLWFEPGLPQRILADAGDAPGRMTLVQFALTRLWERRTRSMLTHAAYDELGGVAGALVGYADESLDALTGRRNQAARRLLVQLARPEGDGFVRRPARIGELSPELASVARDLAPGKLVVLSPDPDGSGEIVDLAHESLTRLWPRLRQWLTDTREFRVWQEQLRTDLRRWEAHDREAARLLGGTDLAEARRRLADHPDDTTPEESAYVRLSERAARRGTRIRRAAVAALAVLTALAAVFALLTWQGLRRTEAQLRVQAAGLLAQAADDMPANEPATALQLALAARSTGRTAKTAQALLRQYARQPDLLHAYPSVWEGTVRGMDATPDGRTLVIASRPAGGGTRIVFTLVTGALDGRIRTRRLAGEATDDYKSAVSPDGRLFTVTSPESIRLWRLDDPEHPETLELPARETPRGAGGSVDFSQDGSRLLRTLTDNTVECLNGTRPCVPSSADAWEVPSGRRLPVAADLLPQTGVDEVAFTGDGETVAMTYSPRLKNVQVTVKELATGRTLYAVGPPADAAYEVSGIKAGGELAVWTGDKRFYSRPLGRTPGAVAELPPISLESRLGPGTAEAYVQNAPGTGVEAGRPGGYADTGLLDLRTGRYFTARLPSVGDLPGSHAIAASPAPGGGLAMLVPVGSSLMVVGAAPEGTERFQGAGPLNTDGEYALAPDRSAIARLTRDSLQVLDSSRTRFRSVALPSGKDGARVTWTTDGRWIVVWRRDDGLFRAYAVADLGRSVDLPRLLKDDVVGDSLVGLQGSEIALLGSDGTVARLDAATGTVLTPAFSVQKDPDDVDRMRDMWGEGRIVPRPGHPGQAAVVSRAGNGNGEIGLWDLRTGKRFAALLQGTAVSTPSSQLHWRGDPLVFSADGSWLAVKQGDGRVPIWDLGTGRQLPDPVTVPILANLVGFGPDGTLLTWDAKNLTIHDPAHGTAVTAEVNTVYPTEVNTSNAAITADGRLLIEDGERARVLDLRPDAQFRALCAAAARDYTPAERKLLPDGTPSRAPCG
ncbi:trypsin-like peptidase domain-containing protein [Streptomyces sp. WAC07061]|uniref:nSTAND1 domain-containing NTPase n=1 Tax=Streptomyces sp. WAC07061 TaxID=2487410 RepID=UPI00163C9CFC|nr:trypsin-like peptidase domain-containing protein [Streptomyces sp. WAC07061]